MGIEKIKGGDNMIDAEIKIFAESIEDEVIEYEVIPRVVIEDAVY